MSATRRKKQVDDVGSVLHPMRNGLTLHCERNHRRRRLTWYLSDGTEIPDKLAQTLIHHPNIRADGDVLPFGGKGERVPCQTYRLSL